VGAVLAVLTLGTVTAASAYSGAGGSGSGAAATSTPTQALTLSPAALSNQLFPGGQAAVPLTAANPNPATLRIRSLTLDTSQGSGGFNLDGAHAGCDLASLSFTAQTNGGAGWSIPAAGSVSINLPASLTMSTSASDACQGANITVYNYLLAATTFPTGDDTYALAVRATDSVGNTSTTSTAFLIDRTKPTAVGFTTTNFSTLRKPELKDTFTLTYSEAMNPASIIAGWDGTTTQNVVVRATNRSSGDKLTVYNATKLHAAASGHSDPQTHRLRHLINDIRAHRDSLDAHHGRLELHHHARYPERHREPRRPPLPPARAGHPHQPRRIWPGTPRSRTLTSRPTSTMTSRSVASKLGEV